MDELQVDKKVAENAFFVVKGKFQEISSGYEDFKVTEVLISHLCVPFVVYLDLHITGGWGNLNGLELLIPNTNTILAILSECSEFALAVVVINDAVDIGKPAEELLISLKEL